MTTNDSWPLTIWSGLFKAKHWKKMGNAIWLFGMLIDKVTREENGQGYVLGGTPITYSTFKGELPITKRQYLRYLEILRGGNYIHTRNTHHGLIIVINKSKKFKRKRDKNVTTPVTKTPGGRDKKVTTPATKKSPPLIDNTVDIKETKSGAVDFMQIWGMLHKVFKLPKSASKSYKDDIIETIQRLGMDTTTKACEEFLKRSADHPPDGRIKSISSFLHWKKIDEYVAMIEPEKEYRYYICLECSKVVKVEEHDKIDQQMELESSYCKDHPVPRHNVTSTVRDCIAKNMSKKQIGTVLKKLAHQINEGKANENSGN